MPSLATRSREVVAQGFAEQFRPVIQLHDDIRRAVRPTLDLSRAASRVLAGVPAFDPVTVVRATGDLAPRFAAAVKAFERSGLATTAAASALRRRDVDATELALAWLLGERPSSDPVASLATRAAALVAGAVLRASADLVAGVVSLAEWERPICPCCGGVPDFALVHGSTRTLICSRCDTRWERMGSGCLACGASRGPAVSRIRSPFLGYVLTICHPCARYLKERPAGDDCQPLVERALTAELDAAAERRGLRI